jgi:hypothetical protein
MHVQVSRSSSPVDEPAFAEAAGLVGAGLVDEGHRARAMSMRDAEHALCQVPVRLKSRHSATQARGGGEARVRFCDNFRQRFPGVRKRSERECSSRSLS